MEAGLMIVSPLGVRDKRKSKSKESQNDEKRKCSECINFSNECSHRHQPQHPSLLSLTSPALRAHTPGWARCRSRRRWQRCRAPAAAGHPVHRCSGPDRQSAAGRQSSGPRRRRSPGRPSPGETRRSLPDWPRNPPPGKERDVRLKLGKEVNNGCYILL